MRHLIHASDLPEPAAEFLQGRLMACRAGIEEAARRAGRETQDIRLIVVTKYVGSDVARILYALGVRDFGENRVQDLIRKSDDLSEHPEARFHFIGHLQRNKLRKALPRCVSIHSVDSVRLLNDIARRLAAGEGSVEELYVEVNISGEIQKTGAPLPEVFAILEASARSSETAAAMRGLMGMAPYSENPETSRPFFRRLREIRDEATDRGLLPAGAGLSMGMSGDYAVAVEEGATVLRIGSALFERE